MSKDTYGKRKSSQKLNLNNAKWKFWMLHYTQVLNKKQKYEFINDYGEEFVSEVYQGKRIEENRYREMSHEQKYAMNKLKELF